MTVQADTQLSPGMAIVLGIVCALMGLVPILVAAGVMSTEKPVDAPAWVLVCAGLAFVLAGTALVVGYGIADGATPDGDLPSGAPFGIRMTQYLLGLGITGSIAGIVSWIAFGPGERRFTATMLLLLPQREVI